MDLGFKLFKEWEEIHPQVPSVVDHPNVQGWACPVAGRVKLRDNVYHMQKLSGDDLGKFLSWIFLGVFKRLLALCVAEAITLEKIIF